jgi:hypothetical protein
MLFLNSIMQTHGAIAATYGCDVITPMTEAGYLVDSDAQVTLCTQWGFYLKDLFRNNYISSSEDCEATSYEREDIKCGFVCNPDQYDDMPDYMASLFKSTWVPDDMDDEGWEAWRDFVCEGDGYLVFFGDHLDPSVSPSDPSFWPIHPTQERVLHVKYMSGGFDDDTWPSDPINEFVCSLSQCYEDGVKDYHDQCCYGHYEYDQLLDFVSGNTSQGFGPTTHALLASLNPLSTSYSLPYIYDGFTWDHCNAPGYDFAGLITDLYEASSLVTSDTDTDDNSKPVKSNDDNTKPVASNDDGKHDKTTDDDGKHDKTDDNGKHDTTNDDEHPGPKSSGRFRRSSRRGSKREKPSSILSTLFG